MAVANKVLIVGGGFSGMAAAIQLAKGGIAVDLLEIDPDWRPLGAGISISSATLRALNMLGVYGEFMEAGFISENVDLYSPEGEKITEIPTLQAENSDTAGGGGIMRPALAKILADKTQQLGVNVMLGCSYKDIHQEEDQVKVVLDDGSEKIYDLLIAADGINSSVREKYFPSIGRPEFLGQVVWRAVMPRLEGIKRPRMWVGDQVKVGVNPVSSSLMYMFITENSPEKKSIDKRLWPGLFANLMDLFPDPLIKSLRSHALEPGANIDYRPLTSILVPAPWNNGRLVLIGDSIAATTPHLASGAGIGIESGIVLADEIISNSDFETAMSRFHERRWERCRMVVENSARLCHIETAGGSKQEHAMIMRESMAELRNAI